MKGRISLLILLGVVAITATSCGNSAEKGSKELQQLSEQVKSLQEDNSKLQKENEELSKDMTNLKIGGYYENTCTRRDWHNKSLYC